MPLVVCRELTGIGKSESHFRKVAFVVVIVVVKSDDI